MKKPLSVVLCLLMIAALLPMNLHTAKADGMSGQCGDNLYWSFDESTGTLTITGSGDMWDYTNESAPWYGMAIHNVVFPEELTGVGANAFIDCYSLTKVTIPDSVTSIRQAAFGNCQGLTDIIIPDSVTSMGRNVFSGCTGLKKVTIGNGLKRVEDYSFCYCTGLTSITIGDSLTDIGAAAFYNCHELRSITMPCSADFEWENASIVPSFEGCTGITEVHLTKGTGWMTDYDETNLNRIYYCYTPWFLSRANEITLILDEGITTIGCHAFSYCSGLRSVTIPSTVTSINMAAFCDTGLTEITIPKKVALIGQAAFSGCADLKSISLGKSVTRIENSAFLQCNNLKDVFYYGTESTRYSALPDSAIEVGNDNLIAATWHYLGEMIEGTVEWNAEDVLFKGATAYVIANGSAQTPRFTVKDEAGNIVDPANYDYEYCENTNAGTGYVIVTFRDGYSGECRGWFKIYLPATTKTWVENVSDGIKVGWEPVEGAAGYVIYRRAWSTTTNGWTEFKRWNNTTETTYIDGKDEAHKVYAGTRYQYGVKAYFARRTDPVSGALIGGNVGDNYNLGEVGPLKTTVRITTRKLVQVRPGKKEMTVKWEKSKNFTGYQIQIATDSAFKQNTRVIKIDNWETYWTTVRDLNSNTTYYVRIRSYQEFEGMTYFGEWSNVISCKTN